MSITAEQLYNKLLEIKAKEPEHKFIDIDLLPFGNVEVQMEELINIGKIRKNTDVIGSFEVIS